MVWHLTDELIDTLRTERPQRDFFDAEFKGGSFIVRVSRTGAKSYVLAYRFQGKRRRLTLGRHPARSLGEARAEALRLVEELEAGTDPAPPPSPTTLRRFYGEVFAPGHVEGPGRLRGSTRRHYRWAFRRHILEADFADLPLVRITEADVESFADGLITRGHSPAAVQGVLNCLATCFRWAVQRGVIDRSPAVAPVRRARRRLPPPDPPRPLSGGQAETLLRAARRISPEEGFHLVLTALHTGLRAGELRGLKWTDVDLDRKRLTVRATRGNGHKRRSSRIRTVDLSDLLAEALASWRSRSLERGGREPANGGGWVFPNRNGGKIDFRNFKKRQFRRIADLAGLPGLEFRVLRETWATLLLGSGRPVEVVSAQMGDTHPGVTARRYAEWIPPADRRGLEALPAYSDTG